MLHGHTSSFYFCLLYSLRFANKKNPMYAANYISGFPIPSLLQLIYLYLYRGDINHLETITAILTKWRKPNV